MELVLIGQCFDLLHEGKGYLSSTRQMLFKDGDGETIEGHTNYYQKHPLYTIDTLRKNGEDVALLG